MVLLRIADIRGPSSEKFPEQYLLICGYVTMKGRRLAALHPENPEFDSKRCSDHMLVLNFQGSKTWMLICLCLLTMTVSVLAI